MPGDGQLLRSAHPLRAGLPQPSVRAYGPWGLLGGYASDVVDFAGPIAFGLAAWASACRLTWLMRWLKTSDEEGLEADPIG